MAREYPLWGRGPTQDADCRLGRFQLPRRALALVRVKVALANANNLGRDLDQLIPDLAIACSRLVRPLGV
jgi:hypothetical protein